MSDKGMYISFFCDLNKQILDVIYICLIVNKINIYKLLEIANNKKLTIETRKDILKKKHTISAQGVQHHLNSSYISGILCFQK